VLEFILSFIAGVTIFFRSRSDAAIEILALRQQVAVLKRKRPRPILNSDGYLLDSGSPYRLWLHFRFGSGVKNTIQGYRFERDRLLDETEEELATAL
jgi:hypothetical protein